MPTGTKSGSKPRKKAQKTIAEMQAAHLAQYQAARAELENASLPSERIETLYNELRYGNWEVVKDIQDDWVVVEKAMARHPNTPVSLLVALMLRHLDAVLENPVCPFIGLESPELVNGLAESTALQLLANPRTPTLLVTLLGSQPRYAWEAMHHIAVAGEAGEEWQDELPEQIRAWVEQTGVPDLAHRVALQEMVELGMAPKWLLEGWEHSPVTAEFPLESFRGDPADPKIREASDPETSLQRLAELSEDWNWQVRLAVIENPSCPADLLPGAAKSNYKGIFKRAVLQHPNLNRTTLLMLCRDREADIRMLARQHPLGGAKAVAACRAGVQRYASEYPVKRFFCVLHPTVTAESLNEAAHAEEAIFRLGFLLNARSNRQLERVNAFTNDGNRFVRAAARERLKNPDWRFKLH